MNKIWNIKNIDEKEVNKYVKKFNISYILAKLLLSKEVKEEDVLSYLNLNIDKLYDPFLLNDMEIIVDRIIKARELNEKITIFGDYDVDGVTSITVLYSFLKDLDINVGYYLPGRIGEGYGLNKAAIKKIKEDGTSLVITVDCGIASFEEVEYAKSIGLDICITDHHECQEKMPDALAIINPKRHDSKYPYMYLAGVGVAFKVISAIAQKLKLDKDSYLKYIDIVALGTIADIVPLLDENRIITYNGLELMKKTKNEGIKALFSIAKIDRVDSQAISFGIAPRINASGRMGNAKVSVRLLLSKTETEAYEYAKVLNMQNINRQEIEKEIIKEAEELINKEKLYLLNTIVIYKSSWHSGIIGIVASKLMEKYLKPIVILTDVDGIVKGSSRTVKNISIYDALSKCSDLLINFGGHELAAGLSLKKENVEKFKIKFEDTVKKLEIEEIVDIIDIDVKIDKKDIDLDIIKEINKLSPFGQKNAVPIFMCQNLRVKEVSTLKDNKHLKFVLSDERFEITALMFNHGERRDEVKLSDKIDIVGNIMLNTFRDMNTVQFILKDFKKVF